MTPDPDKFGAWAYRPQQPVPGAAGGPLSGLLFNVKDLYSVDGWPLTASTQAQLPPVPPSPLVTRLLDLGATLTGKTHLHEIALGITGANPVTAGRNPLDPARVPGGSSSGAAITVARGEVDFALGTDTGGSIRVPAAWCGVVGFKPTKDHPAWPTTGILPLSQTCDHAGPLTRDVATAARLHAALSGEELGGEALAAKSWDGLRVGLWRPEDWLQAEALSALDAVRARVEALGATVEEFQLPDMLDAYTPIVQSEAAAIHAAALNDSPTGFSAGTEALLRLGTARPPQAVLAARIKRDSYRARLEDLLTQFDVLLAPAVPGAAPEIGQEDLALPEGQANSTLTPLRVAVLRLTVPFSLLGVPVVSLPCPAGALSVGVQLVGSWNTDAELLGLALGLEAALVGCLTRIRRQTPFMLAAYPGAMKLASSPLAARLVLVPVLALGAASSAPAQAAALWVGADLRTNGLDAHAGSALLPVPFLGTVGVEAGATTSSGAGGLSEVRAGGTLRDLNLPLTKVDALPRRRPGLPHRRHHESRRGCVPGRRRPRTPRRAARLAAEREDRHQVGNQRRSGAGVPVLSRRNSSHPTQAGWTLG